MTVACILQRKGREVSTIEPTLTLRDVVDVLAAKHIGALVIADAEGRMHGIVSERDVVRAIAQRGPDALDHPVSDYMTRNVVTTTAEEGIIAAVQKMSDGRFRHMPVMEGDRLVGLISTGDAVKYRLEQMEHEQAALRDYITTG